MKVASFAGADTHKQTILKKKKKKKKKKVDREKADTDAKTCNVFSFDGGK